jgi:hypothetical protein
MKFWCSLFILVVWALPGVKEFELQFVLEGVSTLMGFRL